ncbi:MAG: PDZ domain-containing protein [Actinobacteria bacterium]|nr:MAG: PDZ domain-containing protein [Actinomycetota bacterium]
MDNDTTIPTPEPTDVEPGSVTDAPTVASPAPQQAPYTAPAVAPVPVKPRSPMAVVVAVAIVIALLFGGAAGIGGAFLGSKLFRTSQQTVRVVNGDTEESVAAAAAAALPSVVNIDITGTVSDDESQLPTTHPDVPVAGNGSGVAFRETEDGGTYILTNDHVAAEAETLVVTDSTGERHDATLVGTDAETDIAVLKVDAKLPTIATGDSETLVVGQVVVAIGSPFGLQHSVTSGVISAIHRSLPDSTGSSTKYPLVDVIQTDAAINPGNSGGALVDRSGALIGIPSAIYSNSGANDGIGFAIPVKAVLRVAEALIETGSVEHPFLGISGQSVTPAFAKTEKLPVNEGAYVAETTKGTEAEKAGLRKGDIIVKLDSTKIRSMDDLILAVRRKTVGDTVVLSLYRDGKLIEVDMKVGVKPANL